MREDTCVVDASERRALMQTAKLGIAIFFVSSLFFSMAHAECSRPILVPASPLGKVILVNNTTNEVTGVFPDVLHEYGKKFGCKFEFPVMPRARAELMMSRGETDLLMGSIKVPERDAWGGDYVPLFVSEWHLISIRTDPLPTSVDELLAKPRIKLYVVRGFNNGPKYIAMLEQMKKRGKLEIMKDPESIARMMKVGRADYTFMPLATFNGALASEGLKEFFAPKIRHLHLKGTPITISGAYLSKKLNLNDKTVITELLAQIRKDNAIINRLHLMFTDKEMEGTYAIPQN